jgi:hypothetical protein
MLACHGDDGLVVRSLWRTAVIFFSFVVSSLSAAVALMSFPFAIDWLTRPGAETTDLVFRAGLINTIAFAWLIITIVTLLPAGLVIAYAEIKAKRNISFFVGMGIFVALLPTAPFLAEQAFSTGQLRGPVRWTAALVGAGMVAGLVYWALVGRHSGLDGE